MSTPAKRLKDARQAAGYETATGAAAAFGWTRPTYHAHENGNKTITAVAAKKYAKAFRVSAAWLLFGQGSPEIPMQQIPPFDSASLTAAFSALLMTVAPDMDIAEAEALVGAALRLVELHHKRRGTKSDLGRLGKAVSDAAKLVWPPESE